jgi:hypothetical protein
MRLMLSACMGPGTLEIPRINTAHALTGPARLCSPLQPPAATATRWRAAGPRPPPPPPTAAAAGQRRRAGPLLTPSRRRWR